MKNGSGSNERLNRIEAFQEEFQREMNQLLKAQVIQQGQMDDDRTEWRERAKQLDARIATLVSAIGEFINRGKPSP
jgi:hypothetical protein